MVLSIVAPIGQLAAALNTVFVPSSSTRTSSSDFEASLRGHADRSPVARPGLTPSYLASTDRASMTAPGGHPDQAGVLAILTQYPPTNDGILSAMPELQRAYPGVRLLDHPERLDKLEFPDGTVVDTIVNAGSPDSHWAWIVEEEGTGLGVTPGTGNDPAAVPDLGHPIYQYDWVPAAIIDTLAPAEGDTPGRYRHQLSGFDFAKLDPSHPDSMNLKYIAARVFEKIDIYDKDALDQAVALLNAQGFEVTKVDDDKLDFGDGQGPIDVIRNMSDHPTDLAWQWLV